MAAGKYNLIIDQGADFAVGLLLSDNGVPKNLTGYNARGQMREKKSSASPAATFVCVITDALTGTLNISLTNATTAALATGHYFYDIELYTAADADVVRLLQGKAEVDGEVTR